MTDPPGYLSPDNFGYVDDVKFSKSIFCPLHPSGLRDGRPVAQLRATSAEPVASGMGLQSPRLEEARDEKKRWGATLRGGGRHLLATIAANRTS